MVPYQFLSVTPKPHSQAQGKGVAESQGHSKFTCTCKACNTSEWRYVLNGHPLSLLQPLRVHEKSLLRIVYQA